MWESNKMEFRPEIIELAQQMVNNRKDQDIKLGPIKKRYSNTIQDTYTSFGCYQCDSIFGDWYVMEARMGIMYEPKELTCHGEIDLKERVELPVPHWCFPDEHPFCTASSLQHLPKPNTIPDALLTLIDQYDPEEYQVCVRGERPADIAGGGAGAGVAFPGIRLVNSRWDGFYHAAYREKQFDMTYAPFVHHVSEMQAGQAFATFDIHYSKEYLQRFAHYPVMARFLEKVERGEPANLLSEMIILF